MRRPVRRNGLLQPATWRVRELVETALLAKQMQDRAITVIETPDFYLVIRPLPPDHDGSYNPYPQETSDALGFKFNLLYPELKPIITIADRVFPGRPARLGGAPPPPTRVEEIIRHELVHHMQYSRGEEKPTMVDLRQRAPIHGLPPRHLLPTRKETKEKPYWWQDGQKHSQRPVEFQPLIGDAVSRGMRHSTYKDEAADLRHVLTLHPFFAWKKAEPDLWKAGVKIAAGEVHKLYRENAPRTRPRYTRLQLQEARERTAEKRRQAEAAAGRKARMTEMKARLEARLEAGLAARREQMRQEEAGRREAERLTTELNKPTRTAHVYDIRRTPDPRDPRGAGQVWTVHENGRPTSKYGKTKQKALDLMAEMEAFHG